MNLKKIQQYYIRSLFKANESNDINLVKSIFKNKFNIPLQLSIDEITKQKFLIVGGHKNEDLLTVCKKLSNDDITINVHSVDIFYNYENKNKKIIKREETVIILTTYDMEKKFKDEKIENYFIDVTYKIVPKNNKNYKLLTITCYDNNNQSTYIIALILIQYEDTQSFIKIFKYLNEMFQFNPAITHIDFSQALRNALLTEGIFKKKPIIVHCFFHFVQNVVKKMKLYGIIKKKINKYSFEILKNIELICFLPPNFIKTYINFLKGKLKDENEIKLFEYLNKNWFNKGSKFYNYFELFDNQSLIDITQHFFATNNIAENLHSKLNLYLIAKKKTVNNFIFSIRNVLINYESKRDQIVRKDYVTKTLLNYSRSIKYNKYRWITYEDFKKMEENVIKNSNKNFNIDAVNELQ